MTDGGHIAQEELILHAMHGSSEEESRAVRAHVERCAECRAELEKLMRDVAVVAMSVDQQPLPAGARQRFMEKISAAPEGVKRGAGAVVTEMRSEPKAGRPLVWIPWAMAAVLALVAVTLGVRINSLDRELKSESSTSWPI